MGNTSRENESNSYRDEVSFELPQHGVSIALDRRIMESQITDLGHIEKTPIEKILTKLETTSVFELQKEKSNQEKEYNIRRIYGAKLNTRNKHNMNKTK
jgi:hypothetical protein